MLCHASVSARSRVYSRLCLIILTILVEEGEGKLTVEAAEIQLCRQVTILASFAFFQLTDDGLLLSGYRCFLIILGGDHS